MVTGIDPMGKIRLSADRLCSKAGQLRKPRNATLARAAEADQAEADLAGDRRPGDAATIVGPQALTPILTPGVLEGQPGVRCRVQLH